MTLHKADMVILYKLDGERACILNIYLRFAITKCIKYYEVHWTMNYVAEIQLLFNVIRLVSYFSTEVHYSSVYFNIAHINTPYVRWSIAVPFILHGNRVH